ncbi:N-acetyltransferase family protein [Saccharospirillum sp.]|uniref:N-acetyltransferase family protein n=1 Tax=Saccharospirillum sp. TaxID=2033801 RepID=UPI00349FF7EA
MNELGYRIINKILSVIGVSHVEKVYRIPKVSDGAEGISVSVLKTEEVHDLVKRGQVTFSNGDLQRIEQGIAVFIAAFSGDILAGYIWYAVKPYRHSGPYTAYFDQSVLCGYGLYIAPDFRGRGIRKSLINEAQEWAYEKGKVGLIEAINYDNPASIKSANKLGYSFVGFSYCSRWLPMKPDVKKLYHLANEVVE